MISGKFEWDNSAKLVDEGLSISDQKKIVKNTPIAAIPAILASVALIYFSIIIQQDYPHIDSFFFESLLVIGISGIVISLLVIFWSKSHKLTTKNDDILDNINPLDTLLFIISSLQILLSINLILYIFVENKLIKDTYLVEHGQDKYSDFSQQYSYLQTFGVLAILVQLISLTYYTYAIYITSLTQFDAKGLVHVFNIVFSLFSLGTLWGAAHCQNYFDAVSTLQNYISDSTIHILYILSAIALFLAVLGFIINTRQSRINYVILGAILLIFVTLLSCVNKEVLSGARTIEKNYIVNCNTDHLIQKVSENYLSDQHCQKYRKTELKTLNGQVIKDKEGKPRITFDLNCPQDFSALVWEEKSEKNQQACLNMECCTIVANSFSIWWYRTGFMAFGMILSGFLTAMSCFFLTQREKLGNHVNLFGIHFTSFLLLLAVLILGVYYVQIYYQYPIPSVETPDLQNKYKSNPLFSKFVEKFIPEPFQHQEQQQQKDLQQQNLSETLMVNIDSQQSKIVPDQSQVYQPDYYIDCKPFTSFIDQSIRLQTECKNKEQNCNNQLKLTINSEAGYFKYSNLLLNDPRFRFFNIMYSNKVLLNIKPTNAFVSLQADPSDLQDFLLNELWYCGANPLNAPLFLVQSKEVSSFKPRNSESKQTQSVSQNNNNYISQKTSKRLLLSKMLKMNHNQENSEIKKCQNELQKSFTSYTSQCLKKNTGNYKSQSGDFTTVWGYESLSPKTTYKIQGTLKYQYIEEPCQSSKNVQHKEILKNTHSNVQLGNLENVEIKLFFEVSGEQKLYSSVKSDKKGQFQIHLPVFYNEINYFGILKISHPGLEDQSFLDIKIQQLLGNPQDINLKDIYLLTNTGLPIKKDCNSSKNTEKKHKKENNNIEDSQHLLEENQVKEDIKQSQLKKCQNRLKDIQNAEATCSFKLRNEINLEKKTEEPHKSSKSKEKINEKQPSKKENNKEKSKTNHSEPQKKKNDKQEEKEKVKIVNKKINKAELNEIQFYSLDLQIYDMKSKHKLNQNIKVSLYKNWHSCLIQPDQQDLFRQLTIEKDNTHKQQQFFNIIEDTYTIVVQTKDYHSYCERIQAFYPSQTVLIPLVKKGSKIQVALEHSNHELQSSLSLQTQQKDGSNKCFVSSYNQECSNIKLFNTENENALGQLITVENDLLEQPYLFFVQKIPYTQKEKLIVENLSVGVNVPLKDLEKTVQNKEFSKGNIRIKLYAEEREFQVQETYIPEFSDKTSEFDPVLTWLSFCINGKQGDVSADQLEKFWVRNTKQPEQLKQKLKKKEQNWWVQNEPTGILNPNSQICSLFYAQTQSNSVE